MRKVICAILATVQAFACTAAIAVADTEFVNISLNRASTVSSISGEEHGASYANDGINDNADNSWWQSAADDTSAWWQLDLGIEYQIVQVEYQPRINAPDEECSAFEIIASNDNTFETYDVLVSQDSPAKENATYTVASTDRYRYIRARKTDGKIFSIAELNIFTERNSILSGATQGAIYVGEEDGDYGEESRYMLPFDVAGTKYEQDAWLLSQLDIMRGYEDGTFRSANRVTRADFATLISRLVNMPQTYNTQTFTDVSASHWAYNYIEQCVAYGYVNGYEDGTFRPDEQVTTTQVLAVFARMLGYSLQAEQFGGWPDGYTAVAGTLGLYGPIESGEDITRGEIAGVLVEVFETEIMATDNSSKQSGVSVVHDMTALRSFRHIVQATGIINAVGATSLTGTYATNRESYVEVDYNEYVTDIPWINDYLGCKVDYYYCEDESEDGYKLVAVIPRQNTILEIEANEDTYATNDRIYYRENDNTKEKYEEISSTIDMIYNGTAYEENYSLEDIVPQDGSIKLIDNNRDGDWDVIVIESEKVCVVRSVQEDGEKIYVLGTTEPLHLDIDNDDITVIDAATNTEMAITDLQEWDVLSIKQNNPNSDLKVFYIISSRNMLKGTVTRITDDTVSIDDVEYELSPSFDIENIKVSEYGAFYFDYKGRLAAYDGESSTSEQYGYIRSVIYDENVDDTVGFKIFTEYGEFQVMRLSERAKVDGILYKKNADIIKHINSNSDNGKGAQIVRFRANSEGVISSLDTTHRDYELENDASLTKEFDRELRYYMPSGIVGMQFARGADTVLMRIPQDPTDDDGYERIAPDYMVPGMQYTFEAYDATENNIMGLFLFREKNEATFKTKTTYLVVEKAWTEINDDDENITYIKGMYEGKPVTYCGFEEDFIDPAEYKLGDIVAINLNNKEEITAIEKRFYQEEKPAGAPPSAISPIEGQMGRPYSDVYMGYGHIKSREGVFVTVEFSGPGEYDEYEYMLVNLTDSALNIYVVDSETKEVRAGGTNDILDAQSAGVEDASKVFIAGYDGEIRQLVVFD